MYTQISLPSLRSLLLFTMCALVASFLVLFTLQSNLLEVASSVSQRAIGLSNGHPHASKPFKERVVHLDLKGAPPRVEYYEKLFPILHELGVDGLLIEWEDAFPYQGRLSILKAQHAYSREDVKRILQLAIDSSLEVIPLIQSFGHLEFVLKHDKFAHLRERMTEDSALCPSRNESLLLIEEMIEQIRSSHPNSTRIHIGSDEVYYVGEDIPCRKALMTVYKENIDRLKIAHIARVARLALSSGFSEVFAWNDMFDKASVSLLKEYQLGLLITPVIWGYAFDVTKEEYFPNGLFERISQVFPRVWFASAFKGANGASNVFISIDRYLANHQSYVALYRQFEKYLYPRVEGLMLTGWGRFSHHQPLCELLPISIPSLVLNLIYTQDVRRPLKDVTIKTKSILKCPSTPPRGLLSSRSFNGQLYHIPRETLFSACDFPSVDLFTIVQDLRFLVWKSHRVKAENVKEREQFNTEIEVMEKKLRPLLSKVLFDNAVEEFMVAQVRSLIVPPPTPSPVSIPPK